jgi:hypothetical protein
MSPLSVEKKIYTKVTHFIDIQYIQNKVRIESIESIESRMSGIFKRRD